MNLTAFSEQLGRDFYAWNTLCPYPREPKRYIEILDSIQAMTTPSAMHLLNCAVRCLDPGECYLEVGTWRGGTFIGAMLGNTAHGYAVDNDAAYMDDHNKDERRSRDVWWENVNRFGLAERSTYIDGATPEVWRHKDLTAGQPVGVYFFDGGKETPEQAVDGLLGALPLLADNALIVADDLNEVQIRQALWYVRMAHPNVIIPLFDLLAPANCWPGWWNGLGVLAWVKK